MPSRHTEAAFETVIEAHMLGNGYERVAPGAFDRERAIFPETVLAFIRETQPKDWAKLEALHGERTGEQVLTDLCKWMETNGSLATLRHGFKCYGRTLRVAFFKAAHELNPELEARYAANRLGITRQLHFSPQSEKSLDVTLSLNGIPFATIELKNPLTGPPIQEQRKIVASITRESRRLDDLKSAAERTIALLKERRSALIAAAVTGQIDVRQPPEASAQAGEEAVT